MSNRDLAVAIMIGLAVVVLTAMLLAWRRRIARDAGLIAPIGVPEHAEVRHRFGVLYVSTTRNEQPLERLALKPLAYRARGETAVTDRGIALALDGAPTVFIATSRLVDIDRATVTIDRVVEPGGLIRLVWNVNDDTTVDSYLRLTDGDPKNFIAEVRRLLPVADDSAATDTGAQS